MIARGSLIALLLSLAISTMGSMASTILPNVREAYGTTRSLTLVGNTSGWNNTRPGPTIVVLSGDTIDIQLSQPDVLHRFYLDVNSNQNPDCPSPDKCGPSYSSPTSVPPFSVDFTPGNYTYYCSIHSSMTGTFRVEGFSITASPSGLTLNRGASQVSTITVASRGGFSGTVNISTPNTPTGISTQFVISSTLSVSPSSPGITSLNVTAGPSVQAGSYAVTVTGSNGTISGMANLAVSVLAPDFEVTSDPNQLSILQGASGRTTLMVRSANGFEGDVNLMVNSSPSNIALSLNPLLVTLSAGGVATVTLNVSTTFGSLTSSPRTYIVTVTATTTGSSPVSHTTTLSVEVKSSPSSVAAPILIGVGIVVAVGAGTGGYVVLRRRSRSSRARPSAKPR